MKKQTDKLWSDSNNTIVDPYNNRDKQALKFISQELFRIQWIKLQEETSPLFLGRNTVLDRTYKTAPLTAPEFGSNSTFFCA